MSHKNWGKAGLQIGRNCYRILICPQWRTDASTSVLLMLLVLGYLQLRRLELSQLHDGGTQGPVQVVHTSVKDPVLLGHPDPDP